ncbi:hypothetical protein BJ875DRAFT_475883 [Amylocarpus encephaloides]|uniref:Uncharacterized protein n=1 Tax=Amylocarpus encephaloides TaxID=45428 RepID=A0A9P7Y8F2_9HELO|nr:hypothetical protein BJ875DRAFT_475883 [Amylocarpus encephaloides]
MSICNSLPPTEHHQHYYCTPFPNTTDDFMPLALSLNSNQLMNITRFLDSNVDDFWPELDRDGFALSRGD